METKIILRELENVKERYKDIITPTFEINIYNMVTSVIEKIEEQASQIEKLEDTIEMFKSELEVARLNCKILKENCEILKENNWIPIEEKLPSSNGEYKVTIDNGSIYTDSLMYSKNLYEVDRYDFEDYEDAIEKDGFYDYWEDVGFYKKLDVIAWMEEPEPYQPKGE